MITYSDTDYILTKEIMLGKATMNSDFVELAEFIDKTFGVKTINIVYDTMPDYHTQKACPRLNIIFESVKEQNSFNKNKNNLCFDSEKQNIIANQFKKKVEQSGKTDKYLTENIWVIYDAFKPVAKTDIASNITPDIIKKIKSEINNKDLWEISKFDDYFTFFLYTDEQVKKYKNSDDKKIWTDMLFDILKRYDIFEYFERKTFNISLDSKENFDKNYQSNWFYYYK